MISPPADLPAPRLSRRALALSVLALTALAAVIYAQCGAFAFLDYDDPVVVTDNEVVQQGLGGESLRFAFRDTRMNLYHPLTWLSHMADVSLFGDWAGGHHLVNALLHLANGVLVFLLVAVLGGRALPSFLVAALFVAHPLHVESVAWISERKDVLSTFFYLLTVLLYVHWTRKRNWKLYAAAVATCLLGFLAKPSLMTLPFALLLLDCWPLQRLDLGDWKQLPLRTAKLALEKFPFFALAAIFMAIAWKVQSSGAHAATAELTTFPERLGIAGWSYFSWGWRTFWPSGLAPFYPHPTAVPAVAGTASWLAVLGFSLLVILLRTRVPVLFFGWFWFTGLLLPASGLITISDAFAPDRYTYLAHLGLFVMVVWGAAALAEKFRLTTGVPAAAATLLIIVLAVTAALQAAHWKSNESLWRHAVTVTKRNYFAHNKLAVILLNSNREEEAIAHLESAVDAKPDFAFAHANLGKVRAGQGDTTTAIAHFQRAIAVKPGDAAMRRALLPLLRDEGRPATDILPHLQTLARLDPDDARVRYDLATLLQREGRLEEAISHYRAAAELTPPTNYLVRGDLGAVLVRMKRYREAIPPLQAAARQPDNPFAPRAHYLLGLAYHKTGQDERAIPSLEAAVAADPALAPARDALERLRAASVPRRR